MQSLEEQIVAFVVNTTYNSLPSKVIEITKTEVLDFIGVALAGSEAPGVKEIKSLLIEMGGKKEARILGDYKKLPSYNAAQINAVMGHALDFDDVHEIAVIHPGVITIPVAIALAEKMKKSGKDLITAIAIGVDLACRLAMAPIPEKRAVATGWHLTTLFGYLVAAAVAAKLLDLNMEMTHNAMGIAYHLCSGNGQCVKDGALTKRFGPSFAVRDGILSALLAKKGVTGARNFLEGEWGLYKLYFGGNYNRDLIVKDLGNVYNNIYVNFKPYPCCRGVHPAIDAALTIVKTYKIDPEEIDKVIIEVSEGHYALLCSPENRKIYPQNIVDAQFSIPWGVAVALAKGNVDLEGFTDVAIRDPRIISVAKK